ncbi:MAG: hypothetical protein PHD95_03865 [Candidatus ainarchaeum sp.]|nr:hypothetical protein [Candidatus ainarchaeum sp.]
MTGRIPAKRIAMPGSIGMAGQFMQRGLRARAGQARARQIMARARATHHRPRPKAGLFAERPALFTREQAETIRGYAAKALAAGRSMQKYIGDRRLVWNASVLAARLRVPKEKFEEAIKRAMEKGDRGLEQVYAQLKDIANVTPRLGLDYAQVEQLLRQHGIEKTHAQLMQKLEQARQMGQIA